MSEALGVCLEEMPEPWPDGFEMELGNFSLKELESIKGPLGIGIERDLYFEPTPLSKIRERRNAK